MSDTEQAMVARLLAPLSQGCAGAFGLLDDAAVLAPPQGCAFVVTMDTLIDGVHFLLDTAPDSASLAARKALAVNISDLVAKGATPHAYALSLSLPPGHERWLEAFVAGLKEAQEAWGLSLCGGDTVATGGPFSVTITAFGIVPSASPGFIPRHAARPGDALLVTGTIGDAWAGLQLLLQSERAAGWDAHLDKSAAAFLRMRSQAPTPRSGLVLALRSYAAAALDVSDGLALDASRLAAASGVAVEIDSTAVPVSEPIGKLLKANRLAMSDLLTGGDDYEVLCAVRPQSVAALQNAGKECGLSITRIGRVAAGSGLTILDFDGAPLHLPKLGWDHLA